MWKVQDYDEIQLASGDPGHFLHLPAGVAPAHARHAHVGHVRHRRVGQHRIVLAAPRRDGPVTLVAFCGTIARSSRLLIIITPIFSSGLMLKILL